MPPLHHRGLLLLLLVLVLVSPRRGVRLIVPDTLILHRPGQATLPNQTVQNIPQCLHSAAKQPLSTNKLQLLCSKLLAFDMRLVMYRQASIGLPWSLDLRKSLISTMGSTVK
jgi:hypothetical protein